jgi:hypothetical protein
MVASMVWLGTSTPVSEAEARRRVLARAPDAHWGKALVVDLDGDGVADFAMLGRAPSQAIVAVVLGGGAEEPFLFTFRKDPTRQDGLCGDPNTAGIAAEPLASTFDPDAPPAAKKRPGARGAAFRLESGDCDSFHFFFDGTKVTWWRR